MLKMTNYEIMLTLSKIKDVDEKKKIHDWLINNPKISFDWISHERELEIEDNKPDPNYYFICSKCSNECSSTKPYYKFKKNPELYVCKDCRNNKSYK